MDHHKYKRIQPWKAIISELEPQGSQSELCSRLAETNAFQKGEHIVIGGQGLDGKGEIIHDTGNYHASTTSSKPNTNEKGTKSDTKSEGESKSAPRFETAKDRETRKSG